MKVRQYLILVTKSTNTVVPKLVFPWEKDCYEEQYGEGNIEFVKNTEAVEVPELPDAGGEFARLENVLGRHAETGVSNAENTFGHGKLGIAALKKAMEKAVIKTRKSKKTEADKEPSEPKTEKASEPVKEPSESRDPLD